MVRRTITEHIRSSEENTPSQSRYCRFRSHCTNSNQYMPHAIYFNENQFHTSLWDMILRTLLLHSMMNNKTVRMTRPALPGAPEVPNVDRGLYDSQCETLDSHIMTRPASKIAKTSLGQQMTTNNPQCDLISAVKR